jgi:hypothetical protein
MSDMQIGATASWGAAALAAPSRALPYTRAGRREPPSGQLPEPTAAVQQSQSGNAYAVVSVDPGTGVLSIKIVDAKTHETIRAMPSEEMLHYAKQTTAYLEAARRRRAIPR